MNITRFLNIYCLLLTSTLLSCIQLTEKSEEQVKSNVDTPLTTSQVVSNAIKSLGHVDTRPRVYFDLNFSDKVRNSDQISFTENLENRQLLKLSVTEAKDRGRISLFLPHNGISSIEIELSDKDGQRIYTKNFKITRNKIITTSI